VTEDSAGHRSTLSLVRYEQGVATTVVFHTQERPFAPAAAHFPQPETVVIVFGGRRFVWHATEPREGEELFPTVTTMIADPNDYEAERLAMERFLSAVAWWTSQPIEYRIEGGAGVPQEMDPPVATARRRGLGNHVYEAPHELVVEDDAELRRVLGYHREGLNTGSSYFKFLAFWNALDIACSDYAGNLRGWIDANAANLVVLRNGDDGIVDWWDHLHNERRSALAHATRDRPGLEIDPDNPAHRQSLERDGNFLRELTRVRVRERWGDRPVWQRRRRA
jgi:hypothetical protein